MRPATATRRAILGGLLLPGVASVRTRAAEEVDLLLVLAVDASGSVDAERYDLQKQGYAAAFRHPRLVQAIQGSMTGAIGVTMTQWTGPSLHVWAVPWMRVSDTASSERLAAAIDAAPRQLFGGGTSISGAITHARSLFSQAPFSAARKVIDISGDGANNRGEPADGPRDAAVADGITINGLPILGLEPFLEEHYREHVIGGPGAFLVVASGYGSFAEAILRKLIREIASKDQPAGSTL